MLRSNLSVATRPLISEKLFLSGGSKIPSTKFVGTSRLGIHKHYYSTTHNLSSSSSTSSYSGTSSSSSGRRGIKYSLVGLSALGLGTLAFSLGSGFSSTSATSTINPAVLDNPLKALDPENLSLSQDHLKSIPLSLLLRSWFITCASSSIFLVDRGESILSFLQSLDGKIPIIGSAIWSVTRWFAKNTFWDHFVGAATAEQSIPIIQELANNGTGTLLAYAAEAAGKESYDGLDPIEYKRKKCARKVNELVHAINVLSQLGNPQNPVKPPTLGLKLTGLVPDPTLFKRVSDVIVSSSAYARGQDVLIDNVIATSPMLSESDINELNLLWASVKRIGDAAKQTGVRVVIDAEETWYQPLIDSYYDTLAKEYNDYNLPPVVYNTIQCNLRSGQEKVENLIARSNKQSGTSHGIKLVRGAYVDAERSFALKNGHSDPAWSNKLETDTCYNKCLELVLKTISNDKSGNYGSLGLMLATHNNMSIKKSIEALQDVGLAKLTTSPVDGHAVIKVDDNLRGRFSIAQLKAMSDNLTYTTVKILDDATESVASFNSTPIVYKYVPYGDVEEALPYLLRRATENKSIIMGSKSDGRDGAVGERRAIGREIRRRIANVFSN